MDTIELYPYLFFNGACKEAMDFYHQIFGGELKVQTYGEVPGEQMPGMEDKIMHADLSGGLISFMASDGDRKEPYGPSFISMSLVGTDEPKLREVFHQLAEGGTITSELKKEFWGDTFGSLTDKFGVDWMVNIGEKKG